MTSAADWISEAEQHVTSGAREARNKLNGAYSAGGASMTLTYDMGGVQPGTWLSVDLEDFWVWQVAGQVATVSGAQGGSTAADHASGSTVYVKPKASKFAILRALNQELQSLASAGMFKASTVDLTYSASAAGYDLTGVTNLEGIHAVYANYSGLADDWSPVGRWDVARNQNTTDFPSGFMLRLFDGGQPGRAVRVVYKSRFTALTALTDDVATTNLPASAYDIPPLGAAARLVAPGEVGRNDTSAQGDTRRSEEVPAGSVGRSAAFLWQLRNARLGEELRELKRLYPNRRP